MKSLIERAFGALRVLVNQTDVRSQAVEILPAPWPYKSILAFNSDVEWTDWPLQLEISQVLASYGLETAHSCWFYSSGKATWRLFDEQGEPTQYYEPALELISGGVLDTIHGYGGILHAGGTRFDRDMILRSYDRLERDNVQFQIFSNHGSNQDKQNIGGDWGTYQEGDIPSSNFYHLDRALAHGIRYFWTDVDYDQLPFRCDHSINGDNSLFRSQLSRDGNKILRFRRFLGSLESGCCATNFGEQIEQILGQKEFRSAVIFQHLGVHRDADGKPKRAQSPIFTAQCLDQLRALSALQSTKEVLVTTTKRLLDFSVLLAVKPWRISYDPDAVIISFDESFEADGVPIRLNEEMLSGWSARTGGTQTLKAFLGTKELPLTRHTERETLVWTIPWQIRDQSKLIARLAAKTNYAIK